MDSLHHHHSLHLPHHKSNQRVARRVLINAIKRLKQLNQRVARRVLIHDIKSLKQLNMKQKY